MLLKPRASDFITPDLERCSMKNFFNAFNCGGERNSVVKLHKSVTRVDIMYCVSKGENDNIITPMVNKIRKYEP